MEQIQALQVFHKVVEMGSFSRAAEALSTSQPSVSRTVARLEERLQRALFVRTTRRLRLTDEGQTLYQRTQALLREMDEVEAELSGRLALEHVGWLRVAAPVGMGRNLIVSLLPAYFERHPRAEVELVLSDSYVDLIASGVELALRIGDSADSTLVARWVGQSRRVTVASTGYLDRHGVPQTPADLEEHECLVYTRAAHRGEWFFRDAGGAMVAQRVRGRFKCDSGEAIREAVLAGLGIACMPSYLVRDELGGSRLKVLLNDYEPKGDPVYLLHPASRFLSPRARLFAAYLEGELARHPWAALQSAP